ncbi:MAG: zinc ribbon domain-containing protein [Candidatus Thorarchaeota archaeon]
METEYQYWKKKYPEFCSGSFLEIGKKNRNKVQLKGIHVLTVNEAHTSKCSFLYNESIESHEQYVWKRTSRGLFKTSDGKIINADVNGAYNIMKKAFPNAVSADVIEVFGLMPQIIQQNIVDTII